MSVIRRLLFNDGEGADFNDVNNLQKYQNAQVNDIVTGAGAKVTDIIAGTGGIFSGDEAFIPAQEYCYVRGTSHGAPIPGGSNLQITNLRGPIYQWTGGTSDPTGSTPKMLMYHLATDELLTTFDMADAANPRIDLVVVKLDEVAADSQTRDFKDATTGVITSQTMNKETKTRLQFQTVKGTAASTPLYPSVPSGYVLWAAVRIPALFASTFDHLVHLRDFRVPMGHRRVRVYASYAAACSDGGWASPASGETFATAASNTIRFPLPENLYGARVVSVAISGQLNTGATILLIRRQRGFTASDTSNAPVTIYDFSAQATGAPTVFKGATNYLVSPDMSVNLLEPVWSSGHKVALLNDDLIVNDIERTSAVELVIVSAVGNATPIADMDRMWYVDFEVAGGY